LRDYITEYQYKAKDDQIRRFATLLGLDEARLRDMISLNLTEANINEFGRFDELRKSVDKSKAKAYFESLDGVSLIPPKVNMKTDKILREFILSGGFEI
jgi:type I restriction enzyme R subunit